MAFSYPLATELEPEFAVTMSGLVVPLAGPAKVRCRAEARALDRRIAASLHTREVAGSK
jgi:hypothetical protein